MTEAMDSRIGVLMSNGAYVYYAFLHGHGKPETVGTLKEIEARLGIRTTEKPSVTAQTRPKVALSKPRPRPLRGYVVTITPSIVTYSSSLTSGEYTVRKDAISSNDAIRQAREERRNSEGRHAVPAEFRAKLED